MFDAKIEMLSIEITTRNTLLVLNFTGDSDWYPNGVNPLPPGCFDIVCAHTRAPDLYAESVYPGNENNMLGVKCSSLSALNSNRCKGKPFAMGYATPHNLKGDFFLKTHGKSPYGLNAVNGFTPTCSDE